MKFRESALLRRIADEMIDREDARRSNHVANAKGRGERTAETGRDHEPGKGSVQDGFGYLVGTFPPNAANVNRDMRYLAGRATKRRGLAFEGEQHLDLPSPLAGEGGEALRAG